MYNINFLIINYNMKIMLFDSGIGLIPFIKEIIYLNKNNEYYLFMDHEFFPYGNKNEKQLFKRLKYLLNKFETLNIDYLYICCNTMSNIYLHHKIKTNYKIKTIFELNYQHLNNKNILVTPSLKKYYFDDERFISCSLAPLIEKFDTRNIILEIKKLSSSKKVILGCTHFPLIKYLFNHYASFEVVSYENEFVKKIPTGKIMKFYGREYEILMIKKFFYDLSISFYDLA